MIVHEAGSRGRVEQGWLKSFHTFSFADYYNPERMNFGALRVLNDDSIDPGMGFGMHPHRDMEIITIPLEGALRHKDSMGNEGVIKKGEVQVMSAGTGVRHSEVNASGTEVARLLQIWVIPNLVGVEPSYGQKDFSNVDKKNKFITIVSPDARDGSMKIFQNAFFSLADIEEGQSITYHQKLKKNGVYIFIISGALEIDGKKYSRRDGIGIDDFSSVEITALARCEVLVMEVPPLS